ncbi:MAG: spermidine/putrescine ABC transporter permease PotC, partial [Anaerolineae bacterium]|nr:spermidine/putrescine ABC transporter permease PotC [Anaerolineae bacterium]
MSTTAASPPVTASRVARHGSRLGRWIGRMITAGGIFGYIFLYAPIVILVVFSFNSSRFVSSWEGFSFRWYRVLFEDAAMGTALRNSLIVAFSSTAISTVFGTMVALAMERYRFFGKTAFDALLYLPIIIPDIAMAVMLLLFFV